MGVWFTALFHAPPGKVIVPVGSAEANAAARNALLAARKATDAAKNSSLDF